MELAAAATRPPSPTAGPPQCSPLMLADRLITLAGDADRAGFKEAATHLVSLVYHVLDEATG